MKMGDSSGVDRSDYSKGVRRVLLLTLGLNLAVVAGKLVAGILAGSLSVISDALHSSADSLNNIVGIFIIRVASSAPDEEHPYGHHKYETLGAFGIAWFLLVTAFQVGQSAVRRMFGSQKVEVDVTALTLGTMVVTLFVNLFVWFYERRRARQLDSAFLMADSQHTLSDIYVSSSILVGLLLLRFKIIDLDAVLALVVAGVITFSAYQIFSSTIPVLVDRAPIAPAFVSEIVRATPGVESVHDIMSHGVPGKVFISMHLVVTPMNTPEAHAITEDVERRLAEKVGPCQVTIHIEPDERSS
jgi:cation diffusion facilitator family transporter